MYVFIDIGSFVTQLMGTAMQASGDSEGFSTGITIVVAGLGRAGSCIRRRCSCMYLMPV